MHVLVTGGAGFIGRHLVPLLVERGHQVTVADNLGKPESEVPAGCRFVQADLTEDCTELFRGADACINMASMIGGIGYFHKLPASILSENCRIYSSTFRAASKNRLRRMVYLSSSMVFENATRFPCREEDVLQIPPPISGYGFSKLAGEFFCRTFWDEHKLPYTIIRPFNAYGNEPAGDYIGYAHVIPDLVKKIHDGQYPLEMLGDGEQTRCFTHVVDIARAIVMALESSKAENEDFNIGTSEETRMVDLARMLWDLCGRTEELKIRHMPAFRHDIRRRVPDPAKANNLLLWKPEISLDEGLKEVVKFLDGNRSHRHR